MPGGDPAGPARYLLAMTRIRLTKSPATLLKGVDRLLVIAPKRTFDDGGFLDVLPEPLMRFAVDLASDLQPGLGGAAAGTLTGSSHTPVDTQVGRWAGTCGPARPRVGSACKRTVRVSGE